MYSFPGILYMSNPSSGGFPQNSGIIFPDQINQRYIKYGNHLLLEKGHSLRHRFRLKSSKMPPSEAILSGSAGTRS